MLKDFLNSSTGALNSTYRTYWKDDNISQGNAAKCLRRGRTLSITLLQIYCVSERILKIGQNTVMTKMGFIS